MHVASASHNDDIIMLMTIAHVSITCNNNSHAPLLMGIKRGTWYITISRRLPGRRVLVVVFIKNMLFEIIAFVAFECL